MFTTLLPHLPIVKLHCLLLSINSLVLFSSNGHPGVFLRVNFLLAQKIISKSTLAKDENVILYAIPCKLYWFLIQLIVNYNFHSLVFFCSLSFHVWKCISNGLWNSLNNFETLTNNTVWWNINWFYTYNSLISLLFFLSYSSFPILL